MGLDGPCGLVGWIGGVKTAVKGDEKKLIFQLSDDGNPFEMFPFLYVSIFNSIILYSTLYLLKAPPTDDEILIGLASTGRYENELKCFKLYRSEYFALTLSQPLVLVPLLFMGMLFRG